MKQILLFIFCLLLACSSSLHSIPDSSSSTPPAPPFLWSIQIQDQNQHTLYQQTRDLFPDSYSSPPSSFGTFSYPNVFCQFQYPRFSGSGTFATMEANCLTHDQRTNTDLMVLCTTNHQSSDYDSRYLFIDLHHYLLITLQCSNKY